MFRPAVAVRTWLSLRNNVKQRSGRRDPMAMVKNRTCTSSKLELEARRPRTCQPFVSSLASRLLGFDQGLLEMGCMCRTCCTHFDVFSPYLAVNPIRMTGVPQCRQPRCWLPGDSSIGRLFEACLSHGFGVPKAHYGESVVFS